MTRRTTNQFIEDNPLLTRNVYTSIKVEVGSGAMIVEDHAESGRTLAIHTAKDTIRVPLTKQLAQAIRILVSETAATVEEPVAKTTTVKGNIRENVLHSSGMTGQVIRALPQVPRKFTHRDIQARVHDISRQQIWNILHRLKKRGFIEPSNDKGYYIRPGV